MSKRTLFNSSALPFKAVKPVKGVIQADGRSWAVRVVAAVALAGVLPLPAHALLVDVKTVVATTVAHFGADVPFQLLDE
jgi:hypothetical protein